MIITFFFVLFVEFHCSASASHPRYHKNKIQIGKISLHYRQSLGGLLVVVEVEWLEKAPGRAITENTEKLKVKMCRCKSKVTSTAASKAKKRRERKAQYKILRSQKCQPSRRRMSEPSRELTIKFNSRGRTHFWHSSSYLLPCVINWKNEGASSRSRWRRKWDEIRLCREHIFPQQ